jgi:hypothetical protein
MFGYMGRVARDVAERFWEKVDRRGLDECWPWTGATHRQGYGKFCLSPGQLDVPRLSTATPAHRVAFRLVHGRWPDPFALHGCDNPPCCNAENPQHIHEGTPVINMQEMVARGRNHVFTGAAHHLAILSEAQVLEIRSLVGQVTKRELARRFGVSYVTIMRVTLGQRY